MTRWGLALALVVAAGSLSGCFQHERRVSDGGEPLACVANACVTPVSMGVPDAGPSMFAADAGPVSPPGPGPMSPADAGPIAPPADAGEARVPTENGYLTCSDIRQGLNNLVGMTSQAVASCQADADCTCVPNRTECDNNCAVAVRADQADWFLETLATVSSEYCIMPEFRAACGMVDADCLDCEPKCIDGACEGYPPVCELEPSFFYQPGVDVMVRDDATRLSLVDYCTKEHCPTREEVLAQTSMRIVGCGVESLQTDTRNGLGGFQWNFELATGSLIGAASFSDFFGSFMGCPDSDFQAGEGPPIAPGDVNGHPAGPVQHRTLCDDIVVEP